MSDTRLRPFKITRNFMQNAEGSCLVEMGNTKVICSASVSEQVPHWMKNAGMGWITAEYAMLPRSTHERKPRESRLGRLDSRSVEISRIIGRALRGVVDLRKLEGFTIVIDCDVLQADGGTRTASINGGFSALYDAITFLLEKKLIKENPIKEFIGAVSVGKVGRKLVLDLSYEEDSKAEVDLNVTMSESGKIIDIQGTGERSGFTREELNEMLDLAEKAIMEIIQYQKKNLLGDHLKKMLKK